MNFIDNIHYAPFIALRYSFSRKRNRFTALIATVSMLGMVIGVASLIVVLSIMNGFSGELRGRILSLVPHGYISSEAGIESWQALASEVTALPDVVAVAPYITDKAILGAHGRLRGAVVTAIDPAYESGVSALADSMAAGSLQALENESFSIVLGGSLARLLGVVPGDQVEVTVPRLTVTPLGVFPRTKRFRVVGLFEVGAQPDTYQAYISLAAGERLLGSRGRVDGLQVRTPDIYAAPATMHALSQSLGGDYVVRDWSETQGSLFRAVKMEKVMVSVLLMSVVAVAAFNIVSTLVMSVTEKRGDIAVLRTMGARAAGIMSIFIAHGLALAALGIGVGALLGVVLALNVAALTAAVESALGIKLFDPSVYFISELPARLLWTDVAIVVLVAVGLSLLATVYPAWRAAQVAPAEVLRYE